MIELVSESVDSQGKTWYQPVIARVKFHSIKIQAQYSLDGLPDFWDFERPMKDNPPPEVGKWYKVELTTKPKTGQGAKEGSRYQDCNRFRLATEDEIPDTPPEDTNPQQNGSQGQYGRLGDEPEGSYATSQAFNQACTLVHGIIVTGDQPLAWDYDNIIAAVIVLRARLYHEVLMKPILGTTETHGDMDTETKEMIDDLPF